MYKFEKLEVYKKSLFLNKEIFYLSGKFPNDLKFSLTSQLLRAAISISANIAEGTGRCGKKESKNFYNIARGSVFEVVGLLKIALMQKYISRREYTQAYLLGEEISKMLSGLIKYNER